MQAFLPSALMAAPQVLPVANPPAPSARVALANHDNTFSRQLEQSRQRAQESARPAPQAAKPAAPPPAPAKPQNKAPDGGHNEAQRAAASRGPRKGEASAKPAAAEPAEPADAPAEAGSAEARDTEAAPLPLNDLLALGVPPAPAVPAEAAPAGATLPGALPAGLSLATGLAQAAPVDPADATATAAVALAAEAPAAAPAAPPTLPPLTAGRGPRDAGASATEPGTWQQAQAAALAEGLAPGHDGTSARLTEAHAAAVSTDGTLTPLGGLAGTGAAGLPTARAGEVAQASLAVPATSPEFRAALGAQVSFFARAGVQQAELHLNPAEMGPVSIQIVLDGQQAQVNFGADSATTRQIIESGMPELASALRDAGLTLAGGGVSQHAGGQRQNGDGSGATGDNGSNAKSGTGPEGMSDAQTEQVRRSTARVALGGVDLYA